MPFHIAQIGSSFAAGPGIPPIANAEAKRSRANFANLVRSRLAKDRGEEIKLTDLSVSGATLLQMLSEPQDNFPPQVTQLPPDADVVLVLGGGNDIGYIGGMFEDTLASKGLLGQLVARVLGGSGAPVANPDDTPEEALAERYGTVLDAIHARAPAARVLVVEYVTMVGPDVRAGTDVPFTADRIERFRAVGAKLQRATALAASESGRKDWCGLIAVDEPSRSHGLGSADPWVNGFTWKLFRAGCAYHPNANGMKGVSELVYQKLVELGLAKPAEES